MARYFPCDLFRFFHRLFSLRPPFSTMFANTTSIDEQLTSFSTAASTLPYPLRTACEEDEESIKNAVGLAALRLAALNDRY
jgi:hypothetical protein